MPYTGVPEEFRKAVDNETLFGHAKRQNIVSFVGTNHSGWFGSSFVRLDLYRSFAQMQDDWRSFARMQDDWSCTKPENVIMSTTKLDKYEYFKMLYNSDFGVCLHGDRRWNNRFPEVMAVGTVPVIIADGLTLPYEPLVNWSYAAVRFKDKQARNVKSILEHLCSITPAQRADD